MTKSALVQVGVHEAKTRLSELLRAVDAGAEVEILRSGVPVARLVSTRRRPLRAFGLDEGVFAVPDDFDAPLPDDVLQFVRGRMTRYLVDTHVWLWLQTDRARLPHSVLADLAEADTIYFSVASGWEIAIKYGIGKLELPSPPSAYLTRRLVDSGCEVVPVELSHAVGVAELPSHHRDPFDRLLIAQAQHLDVPIVTADRAFELYDVATITI